MFYESIFQYIEVRVVRASNHATIIEIHRMNMHNNMNEHFCLYALYITLAIMHFSYIPSESIALYV